MYCLLRTPPLSLAGPVHQRVRSVWVQSILEEEEELISAHRAQIERTMALVRDEMNLLGEVQLPACCA